MEEIFLCIIYLVLDQIYLMTSNSFVKQLMNAPQLYIPCHIYKHYYNYVSCNGTVFLFCVKGLYFCLFSVVFFK